MCAGRWATRGSRRPGSTPTSEERMARSDVHARRLLIALLIGAVLLAALLLRPFWVALFLAAVLAATLRRPMEWLTRLLRGRRNLAAWIVTVAVLLAVV